MKFRGILPRAIVAEIVHVDAVDDVRNSTLTPDLLQAFEKLVLTVEAAIGVVLEIIGILEFVRRNQLVPDAELPGELDGVALVRFGDRGGVGRNRN